MRLGSGQHSMTDRKANNGTMRLFVAMDSLELRKWLTTSPLEANPAGFLHNIIWMRISERSNVEGGCEYERNVNWRQMHASHEVL